MKTVTVEQQNIKYLITECINKALKGIVGQIRLHFCIEGFDWKIRKELNDNLQEYEILFLSILTLKLFENKTLSPYIAIDSNVGDTSWSIDVSINKEEFFY